jgi:hypothetical protein
VRLRRGALALPWLMCVVSRRKGGCSVSDGECVCAEDVHGADGLWTRRWRCLKFTEFGLDLEKDR